MSVRDTEPEPPEVFDSIPDLRAFVDVVESGSFTAAARLREVSTKWVSRRVQRLEDRLGARVLERTTRRVELTDAGARLYPFARSALDAVDAASEVIRPPPGDVVVRIAVPAALGLGGWMRALVRLQEQQPGLRVEVRFAAEPLDLIEEGLDAQLATQAPPWPTVRVRRLATLEHELWAAPGVAVADLDALRGVHAVLPRAATGWTLHGSAGVVEVQPPCRVRADGDAAVLAAVYAGAGVGALAPGPHPGLQRVLPEWTANPIPLYALTPRAGRRGQAVEAVLALPPDGRFPT